MSVFFLLNLYLVCIIKTFPIFIMLGVLQDPSILGFWVCQASPIRIVTGVDEGPNSSSFQAPSGELLNLAIHNSFVVAY